MLFCVLTKKDRMVCSLPVSYKTKQNTEFAKFDF
jgi:hypothetical protein